MAIVPPEPTIQPVIGPMKAASFSATPPRPVLTAFHVMPPSVECRAPFGPSAHPLVGVENRIFETGFPCEMVMGVHVAPPSVVRTALPSDPAASAVLALIQNTVLSGFPLGS